jgi:hypothetical protein
MRNSILLPLIIVTFMVGMFLSRPFRLGIDYTFVGVLTMVTAGLIVAILFGDKKMLVNGLKVATGLTVYWWFLAAHSYVSGAGGGTFAFTAFVTNSLAATACALFFSSLPAAEKFFRYTVFCVCALTVSALLTFALYLLGTPFRSLVWGNLPVSDEFYARSGDLLFPLSLAYNYQYYGPLQIPRMSFGLREVGITQAFLGWVAVASLYVYNFEPPKWLLALLGIAILFTQSTTLIVTAILFFVVYVAFARFNLLLKLAMFAVSMVGAFYAVFIWLNDATFGFASKANTESLTDRTWAITNGLENFFHNPVGIGLYNAETKNASITLVAQLQEIGLPGALGFAAVLWFVHRNRLEVGGTLVPYLPILAAAITTQPLLDAPGFLPLIFALFIPVSTTAAPFKKLPFWNAAGSRP